MNITKKKQTHRYREQTSDCQWGSERHKVLGVRQVQGCIAQHEEYSQYFVTTINEKQP